VNAKLTDRIVMSSVLDQISRNTWIIRYTTYDGLTENIGAQDRISTQVLELITLMKFLLMFYIQTEVK